MNTCFQRLLDQATTDALHATQYAQDYLGNPVARQQRELQLEKFAELIVQECAALTKSKSEHIQSMLTDDRGDRAQIHSLAWQFEEFGYEIKKHFGVEE